MSVCVCVCVCLFVCRCMRIECIPCSVCILVIRVYITPMWQVHLTKRAGAEWEDTLLNHGTQDDDCGEESEAERGKQVWEWWESRRCVHVKCARY